VIGLNPIPPNRERSAGGDHGTGQHWDGAGFQDSILTRLTAAEARSETERRLSSLLRQ
jgi:hypothetical protein